MPRACFILQGRRFSSGYYPVLNKIFGLDVILHIGTLRYEEHKTYAEIKEALRKKNIKISMGELTNLTMTFESLIKGWHEEHIQEMRKKRGMIELEEGQITM